MILTLPSPARMLLALVLVTAAFGIALAVGRASRRPAPTFGPARLQPAAARVQAPAVTAPPALPPLPALKVFKPRGTAVRAARVRGVI